MIGVEFCACAHMADEHDAEGECQVDGCSCSYFDAADPDDAQTAPDIDWPEAAEAGW